MTVQPLAAAPPALAAATPEQRARIDKTAQKFEGAFLQVMMGQMFDGVSAGGFGGGEGEQAFKSFLTDAFAQAMVKHGGVGLSAPLSREMLKMQGLS